MSASYYEADGITIYHGDCREVLPALGSFDLLLTDPPYGIGSWSATGGNSLPQAEVDAINRWDVRIDEDTIRSAIQCCRWAVIWGGNYYADILGRFRTPLVWDKAIRGMHFADGEMAWTNFNFGTLRIFAMPLTNGDTKGQRLHPTQKPEAVMAWSINQVPQAQTILDPFMGSGATLVAAKRLGRKAIGIELEEKYCEIAAQRLSQGALPLAAEPDATSRSIWEGLA